MLNYMKALHQRFKRPSRQSQKLERQADSLHKQLSARLAKPERKLLLQLADLESALLDQVSLDSFAAGFRLADGVHRELSEQPPYSFEAEEERRARKIFEREGR